MASFTCITCQVAFNAADIQRSHYKTDWHRYNLKRKIAEFPPVSAAEFERRVAITKQEAENKNQKKNYLYCTVCKKSFGTDKSFENHLNSKKHADFSSKRENSKNPDIALPSIKKDRPKHVPRTEEWEDIESESDVEEVDSDEWEAVVSDNNPILYNNCLFCSHHSASLTKNVKHMTSVHSFFIPDVEYLADLKGLLIYLGEKVCQGFLCIWCSDNKTSFVSMEAAQNDMVDKGHTKMLYTGETLLEYADFYYYSEEDSEVKDKEDEKCDYDDAGAPNLEETFMVLPSGATIGHRSLMRYFRQNVPQSKAVSCVGQGKLRKVMAYYKSLGWAANKETATKNVRDLKYMNYVQSKYAVKLSTKANKLQRYFRQQVDF